ncbi:metallophosphoesterase [Ammoniphilus oxalaticus]|uniref:Metallophosphoesterase n=1 Tax=Ammoniphilus oxalaticus TaxID=66863 RepID=A0A419SMN2_9BACL|nr:metallophosphoesterase [Ammoniphilus oxalaticus]RKD25503.1 metallophosphoesterase [Ammoniphilus oxalaticus]
MVYVICFIALGFGLFYAHWNTRKAVFTRVTLPIHEKDWDAQLHVLHLSDLHMENLSISPSHLVEKLEHEDIDLIALTGDYLDRARSIPKFLNYIDKLKEIPTQHGIYVVFGNHDYVLKAKDFFRLTEELERRGCHLLFNEHIQIEHMGKKINIIGIDDNHSGRSRVEKSFTGVCCQGLNLVLTHDPNIVLKMREYHYHYLLSGHFHGGQIHYPKAYHLVKMGKLPRMKMIKGLHYHENKAFYISEGLGQTGFNIRLRSKPEITLHTLVPKN